MGNSDLFRVLFKFLGDKERSLFPIVAKEYPALFMQSISAFDLDIRPSGIVVSQSPISKTIECRDSSFMVFFKTAKPPLGEGDFNSQSDIPDVEIKTIFSFLEQAENKKTNKQIMLDAIKKVFRIFSIF